MARRVLRAAAAGESIDLWSSVPVVVSAQQRLQREQIVLPERPGETAPRLPQDPTTLEDSTLMTLFRELTEWAAYQGARLAVAEVEEESFEAEVKRFESLSAARNSGEKTVSAAKAKVYEDPDYIKIKEEAFKSRAHAKILRGIYEATTLKSTLLSRELTRRVGRDPRDSRSARFGA